MNIRSFILLPSSALAAIIGVFLLVPNAIALYAFDSNSFLSGQVWRIVTYPFVHSGTSHLYENIVALCVASLLAYEVEMTPWQYAITFFASLIVVALADLAFMPSLVLVGISAIVYAIYGAFAMKGSIFVSRSWLVPILGATIWTKYGMAFIMDSMETDLLMQTLLHLVGFATGICVMMACLEIAKANRKKVFT